MYNERECNIFLFSFLFSLIMMIKKGEGTVDGRWTGEVIDNSMLI